MKPDDCKLIRTIQAENQLGENILWHPTKQQLWWTDVLAARLYCLTLGADETRDQLLHYELPQNICSFGFVKDSDLLIAAFESGIGFYDVASQAIDWIAKVETDRADTVMNDGRVDADGRFWFGGALVARLDNSRGTGLYSVDKHLQVRQHLDGLRTSNGLSFSPCGDFVYHTDTPSRDIHRYQLDRKIGTLSNQQLLVQTKENHYPDGAIVDSEGGLWSAQWGGVGVVRYGMDGKQDMVLPIAASQVTCVGFAGENMDLLCVTTASTGLSEQQIKAQPLAGSVFIYQTPCRGLPQSFFLR